MSNLIDEYLIHKEMVGNRAISTVNKYRKYLLAFEKFLEDTPIQEATRQQIEDFVGRYAHVELKLSPSGRKPLVAAVRGFFGWLESQGHIVRSPAASIPHPKVGRKLPVAMQLSNAERLLMQPDLSTFIGVRDAAILSILIGSGPRVAGVAGLNDSSLLWYTTDGTQHLNIKLVEKGGKERIVPAHQDTMWIIRAYLGHEELEAIDRSLPDGDQVLFVSTKNRTVPEHEYYGERRRLSTRSIDTMIKKYGAKAGIPEKELHAHALRHLFGAELAEGDVDLLVRQALMGHADPKTTEIYSHLATRKLTKASRAASPLSKIYTPTKDLAQKMETK